jgi:hypothetical protein
MASLVSCTIVFFCVYYFFQFFKNYFIVWGRGTLWYLKRFLQHIKYIRFEFTHSTTLCYSPSPIQGIVSTGIFVLFIFMYTQYLHQIHPPTTFSHFLPSPTGFNHTPPQDLFLPLVLILQKKGKTNDIFASSFYFSPILIVVSTS